jgi:hypothetical protein
MHAWGGDRLARAWYLFTHFGIRRQIRIVMSLYPRWAFRPQCFLTTDRRCPTVSIVAKKYDRDYRKFNLIAQYNRFADAARIEGDTGNGACLTQSWHRPENQTSTLPFSAIGPLTDVDI